MPLSKCSSLEFVKNNHYYARCLYEKVVSQTLPFFLVGYPSVLVINNFILYIECVERNFRYAGRAVR